MRIKCWEKDSGKKIQIKSIPINQTKINGEHIIVISIASISFSIGCAYIPPNYLFINNTSYCTMSTDRFVAYTDGSCLGNQNVKTTVNPAGFGVVVLKYANGNGTSAMDPFELVARVKGPVMTDPSHADYIGAEKGISNIYLSILLSM